MSLNDVNVFLLVFFQGIKLGTFFHSFAACGKKSAACLTKKVHVNTDATPDKIRKSRRNTYIGALAMRMII